MSSTKAKKTRIKGTAPGHGMFVGGTLAALVISVVLIALGSFSSREPVITPPENSSNTPPSSAVIAYGTSYGAPNAPITLVIYSDFQCYFCQEFALGIQKQMEATYVSEGKVRMVYKHRIGYGDESWLAAEASECASEQNQFWPYHDLLMQLRLSNSEADLTTEKLIDLARELGLDVDKFTASLTSGKFTAKVKQESDEGMNLGFTNIPKFYFNGVVADDSIGDSFANFQKVIDAELARLGK